MQLLVPCSSHSRALGPFHLRPLAVSRAHIQSRCEHGRPPTGCVRCLGHLSVAYRQRAVLRADCSACGAREAAAVQLGVRTGECIWHPGRVHVGARNRVPHEVCDEARPHRRLDVAHGVCEQGARRMSCSCRRRRVVDGSVCRVANMSRCMHAASVSRTRCAYTVAYHSPRLEVCLCHRPSRIFCTYTPSNDACESCSGVI